MDSTLEQAITQAAIAGLVKQGLLQPSTAPLKAETIEGGKHNLYFVKLCGKWVMVWYEFGKWQAQYQQSMNTTL